MEDIKQVIIELEKKLQESREEIAKLEDRIYFLQKHNFQEEARIINFKIGAMFRTHNIFLEFLEDLKNK